MNLPKAGSWRALAAFSAGLLLVAPAVAQEPSGTGPPEWATLPIPEPLLSDMVLPLGTERGQVEINSIFRVPIEDGKIISVPEAEGTVLDGLSFELEIELQGSRQNGWSAGAQWTIGRASRQRFVHGLQFTVERDDFERTTEIVALYVPAYRFSPVWSALVMVGGRTPVSGDGDPRYVFNGSVFAEVNARLRFGLELNYRADTRRTENRELIPQLHWGISNHVAMQVGVGFGKADNSTKSEAILRAIYAF